MDVAENVPPMKRRYGLRPVESLRLNVESYKIGHWSIRGEAMERREKGMKRVRNEEIGEG